ncbi:MAG: membrane protein insertion efficiency factor YidD [Clostridia bacterium]|nr:membrane protein insertion efficiency factor YidD [Clostridia bacterium]
MKKLMLLLIKFYQRGISPVISASGHHCKYYPSCSEYMKQAIVKYGVFKGFFLGIIRLLKCNPFSKGGYDPLK